MNNARPVTPLEKQWVATIRIAWLTDTFREALEPFTEKSNNHENCTEQLRQLDSFFSTLDGIDSTATELFQQALSPGASNVTEQDLEAVTSELTEEILYDLRERLPLVMDERYYCPLARHLVISLCQKVAIYSRYSDLDDNDDDDKDILRVKFVEIARKAKEELISCSTPPISHAQLQFSSGLEESPQLRSKIAETVTEDVRPLSCFFQHSLIEKGYQAVAHNVLQFHDSLRLLGEEPPSHVTLTVPKSVVMATVDCVVNEVLPGLASAPVSIGSTQPINLVWYLHWQIIWVVYEFSEVFLKEEGKETFLLDLCKELGADMNIATFVTERGLRSDNSKLGEKLQAPHPRKHKKAKKKKRARTSDMRDLRTPAKLIYEGQPNTIFPGEGDWPPGWTQKTFEYVYVAVRA